MPEPTDETHALCEAIHGDNAQELGVCCPSCALIRSSLARAIARAEGRE